MVEFLELHQVSERVLETARWWQAFQPGDLKGNLGKFHPKPITIPFDEKSTGFMRDFRRFADEEYSKAEDKGDVVAMTVWGRANENARNPFLRWLNQRACENMGAKTRNKYRESMITFSNWAVRNSVLAANPFARVPKAKESSDRRHVRRALTSEEIVKLLDAAEARPLTEVSLVRRGANKGKTLRISARKSRKTQNGSARNAS